MKKIFFVAMICIFITIQASEKSKIIITGEEDNNREGFLFAVSVGKGKQAKPDFFIYEKVTGESSNENYENSDCLKSLDQIKRLFSCDHDESVQNDEECSLIERDDKA